MFPYQEFIQALLSWRFAASLMVSVALLFLGLSTLYPLDPTPPTPDFHPFYFNAYDAWRVSIGAFVLLAPLAAVIPYADSYLRDREQGFARYVLLRMTHGHYLAGKLIVNGLIGGLAVALPMGLFFGYTSSVYPRAFPPPTYPYTGNWTNVVGFLSGIYIPHPDGYIFARLMLGFLFGVTHATLGMAISPLARNRYIVLAFPIVFSWAFGFIANFVGAPEWWPAYVLAPDSISSSTAATIFTPLIVLFILSLISVFGLIRKYNDQHLY